MSAVQDPPKHNNLIQNAKVDPHKLFKVSSFAFVHPVDNSTSLKFIKKINGSLCIDGHHISNCLDLKTDTLIDQFRNMRTTIHATMRNILRKKTTKVIVSQFDICICTPDRFVVWSHFKTFLKSSLIISGQNRYLVFKSISPFKNRNFETCVILDFSK